MYKLEDIIEDLKTEKPEVSVWEVIECLEQMQAKVEELKAKLERLSFYEDIVEAADGQQSIATVVKQYINNQLGADEWPPAESDLYWAAQNTDIQSAQKDAVIEELQAKVEELTGLLKAASCPNRGCIDGYYLSSTSEPEPCQWCYEAKAALKQEGE